MADEIQMAGVVTGSGKSYRFTYRKGMLMLYRKSTQGPGWVLMSSRHAQPHREAIEDRIVDIRNYLKGE